MRLFLDSFQVSRYLTDVSATITPSWLSMCRMFLSSLISHIDSLSSLMFDFAAIDDHDSCMSIRFSAIINFTILAELYHILADSPRSEESSSLEFRLKCNEALRSAVNMTQGLSPNDYSLLDPFLLVCFCLFVNIVGRNVIQIKFRCAGREQCPC